MVKTEILSKRFGNVIAVDGISLEAKPGQIMGLLGPNGAGKTTMIRMLSCLISPTSGRAWVAGYEVGKEDGEIRRRVGIVTESPGLYDSLSAKKNLEFYATLYGVEVNRQERQIKRYLSMLGLWEKRDAPVATFSKGMKQKVSICRALLHEPAVLFLDEPTAGLDPEAGATVRQFIAALKEEGRTIILCTHNLDEADRVSDRVAVLRQKLIQEDTPANLRQRLYGRRVAVLLASGGGKPEDAVRIAERLPFVRKVVRRDQGITLEVDDPDAHVPDLVEALVNGGCRVRSVSEPEHSLEEVYMNLMREASS